ncbi:OmpA family protein [Brumicola nitratireducens]|uniref:OmpA/MotB n=1 Tax=Glaciecola nitratireducens (strain JCM 12485 / KCTC 12276 / FR1064) TaxID=1085623 RepID=G4QIS5_GLANF|nr:OmpA family protein [Glaciecola nitratireducens]AEP31230.1 OmpA/MotB [Glaciecola nitratireducens FR1064]
MQDKTGFQQDVDNSNVEDSQLETLRRILIGKEVDKAAAEIRAESREMVSDVLSEALHDREKKDGSVQRIIQPIIAKSVEKSLISQRKDFIDYLYPLVGSLVRKAVSVFFTDFIEKTNEIIENSITAKGIKWRINAWRSGISFSEYVASQTFVFKVEQVFLIHKDTGNLLKSVVADNFNEEDADLVSAMLTAINDFVADSFNRSDDRTEQHLDTVKTDDFTLLVRQGPQAILVAAVSGNISRKATSQLQITLEEIQRIYLTDFKEYTGDSKPFETADALLQDCLLSEVRDEHQKTSKKPIFGWLLVVVMLGIIAWYSFAWWSASQTINKINKLEQPPGVLIQKLVADGRYDIKLYALRDPAAQEIGEWLSQNSIEQKYINIAETPFISIDKKLITQKISTIVDEYDTIDIDTQSMALAGNLQLNDYQILKARIDRIPGAEFFKIDSQAIEFIDNEIDLSENNAVNEQIFIRLVGEISSIQIGFDVGETALSPEQSTGLDKVSEHYNNIERLAKKLNRSTNLVIVGASDSTGERGFNQRLSGQRSLVVREALIARGLKPEHVFSVGIGEIELPGNIKTTRKVLFNVMFAELND